VNVDKKKLPICTCGLYMSGGVKSHEEIQKIREERAGYCGKCGKEVLSDGSLSPKALSQVDEKIKRLFGGLSYDEAKSIYTSHCVIEDLDRFFLYYDYFLNDNNQYEIFRIGNYKRYD